jgi:hypothetical protein
MDAIYGGIDVSKDRLDVAVHPAGESFAVSRNGAGIDDLVERLKPLSMKLVAIEATGGFETVVAAGLAGAGLGRQEDSQGSSEPRPGKRTFGFNDYRHSAASSAFGWSARG